FFPRVSSNPKLQPPVEHIGQGLGHVLPNLLYMIARAEVRGDDQFVVEAVSALDQVVEVHMAELVDLVLAVPRRDERQLGNQYLRLEHRGACVESLRRAVAKV